MRTLLACLVLVVPLVACSSSGDDVGDDAPANPTWYQDVAPLVAGHCQGCHTDGGIAPFPLMTYEDAVVAAPQMADMVDAGLMPPFGAVPGGADGCTPSAGWKDDPTLTAAEKAIVRTWADAGAPAGDAAHPAQLPTPPDIHLAGVTDTVAPLGGWTTSGTSDQFMCLVYDPLLTSDRWLTGIEFKPTDASVVHHAGAFVDPTRSAEALAGPDGVYDCFGGVGLPGSDLLGAYTPGTLPFETIPGAGILVPAGSLVVVQIHYHPLGAAGPVYDATELAMRLTTTPPTVRTAWAPIGNEFAAPELLPGPDDRGAVEFRIPASIAGHTEEMRIPLPVDQMGTANIVSIFPHMHYVGTRLVAQLHHSDGTSECLVDAGRYNFNWQRMYNYAGAVSAMPQVRFGDSISVRCTYDNTVNNANVMKALTERGLSAPVDVYSGEQTLDEMCLILAWAALP